METIPESRPIVEVGKPMFSGGANDFVQQVEQAALQAVSSAEKLQLVEELTGYVSDALAEGSLANEELHYVFQLTTQLGKVIEGPPESSSPANAAGPQVHNTDGSQSTEVTMQAAAEALLNAARHNQKTGRRKATASRYRDDGSSKLVTSLHATASGSLEAEGHVGVGVRVGKPHATPYQQGLQANVSRNVPAHLRLHQLSETWRSHKEQLRLQQQEKDARAASPTPPARLSSQARQRAADRLYAHAVQRQKRQQAAREERSREGSPPGSPTLHAPRNAQGFFQRQQDLLVRRQWWAEQRRPRDEESLQHCTGRPLISDFAHSLRRSRDDLLAWNARKEERVKQLRIQQALQDSEEVTLTPRINPASRHMALRLAHRAAQQDPQLLTVIQSQPEGWVLGDRPAPAHRPSTQGPSAAGKGQGLEQPAWVKARAATSMRVLQRAADKGLSASPPPSSWLGSQRSHSVGSAAFEEAPWMGHGGVRHMDAGHLEASLKRCETCSGHSIGVATPTPGRLAAAHHASGHSAVVPNASKHRDGAPGSQAAAPHAGQSAAAQERPEGAFRPEAAALAASGHADDDSSADRGHDESAQATGQGMSSAYKVDAVAEARRLNEQQGSSGFHGFDVNSGRPTPDLIKGLPADTAMKAKQPSSEPSGERRGSGEAGGERRSSGEPNSERRVSGEKRISKGPLHDALGSGGYAAGSLAAANARRSSDLQRAPPSMQIPVPSPKLSGKVLRAKALKAATEAAAKATGMPSRPMAPAKADASEAAGAEAMTQFSIAAGHAEQGRPGGEQVVSMHSVMKHKPAPLIPKRLPASLDMRAYSAAIEHMLAVKDSGPSPAVRTHSKQARSGVGKKENALTAAASRDAAARRLFTPATTDVTGYRKKHGKRVEAA
ncbi:hypothetical protein WJX79_005531 [Trebouxia sp. C0005]